MSHVFFKSLDPPTDQFGPQWRCEGLEQLVLGHNVLTNNVQVLSFFPRPSGNLRLALVNAPPGPWEVALQIATWPSSAFGENQLKLLRFTKKLSVQAGTTAVGMVDAYIGTLNNVENYLDLDEGNPVQVSLFE